MSDLTILFAGFLMSLPGIIAVVYMLAKPSASESKVDVLRKQVIALEKMLDDMRHENRVLSNIVSDQTRRISDLESKHRALTEERNRLSNKLREAEETIFHLEKVMKGGHK